MSVIYQGHVCFMHDPPPKHPGNKGVRKGHSRTTVDLVDKQDFYKLTNRNGEYPVIGLVKDMTTTFYGKFSKLGFEKDSRLKQIHVIH